MTGDVNQDNASYIKALFDTVLDGLIVIDEFGLIQQVNLAATKVFGYSKEEMLGHNVSMLMPSPQRQEHDGYLKHYCESGEAKIIGIGREVVGLRKDGTQFAMDLGISQAIINGKRIFVGTTRDISQSKHTQEALQAATKKELESIRHFKALFETVIDGLIVINARGLIQNANPAASKIFGYALDELVGENVSMLMPSPQHEEHDRYLENYCKTGQAKIIGIGREVVGKRKSGELFAMELGISETEIDGERMFVGTTRDVSERKYMERLYRLMSENVEGYATLILDSMGRVKTWNTGVLRLHGYNAEDVIGQSFERFYTSEDIALNKPERLLQTAYQKGHANEEGWRVRKDGTQFYADIVLNRLQEEDGSLLGFVKVTRDITERQQIENELKQAYANLEEFTSVASHDLKSPLRGIADLVEWINEDLGEDTLPEVKKNLERVQIRVTRMEHLIDDLLKYSRAGRASAEVVLVNPMELIAEVLELQPVPEQFKVVVSGISAPFHTAATPLKTTLRNLISNAIKHHDKTHGTIEIKVKTQGSFCVFSIQDDGPGVPQSAQERVFKLFQTLSNNKDASGVGLAVSKRMVEAHGGRIELHSVDGERGTKFNVFWPRFVTKVEL